MINAFTQGATTLSRQRIFPSPPKAFLDTFLVNLGFFFFNVSSYQALAMCQASGTSPVSLKPWEPGGEVAVVLFIRPRCSEWAFLGGIRLL